MLSLFKYFISKSGFAIAVTRCIVVPLISSISISLVFVESLTILKDAVSGIKKALPAVKTNVVEYVEVKFNLPFRFNYE